VNQDRIREYYGQSQPGKHPDGLVNKARTVYDLFHKECWSFLTGNGSMAMTYRCKCGWWDYQTDEHQYRLVRIPKGE
jgi:hypothetical protein